MGNNASIEIITKNQTVGVSVESGNLKDALDTVFGFVRFGNKYFDTESPWQTRSTDPGKCAETIYNCIQIIANLALLLEPFLPFSSCKIKRWLSLENNWAITTVSAGFRIPEPEILFERLDKRIMEEELKRLDFNP